MLILLKVKLLNTKLFVFLYFLLVDYCFVIIKLCYLLLLTHTLMYIDYAFRTYF